MRIRKFDVNKDRLKKNLKQNQNKRIKHLTILLSVFIIALGVICFTFARFDKEMTITAVSANVGEFTQMVDVEFDLNCSNTGLVSENTKSFKKNKPYSESGGLPTATCLGYDFIGWYLESNGTTRVLDSTNASKDVTRLYAKWTEHESTLTINPSGGLYEGSNQNQEFQLKYKETKAISVPTRVGHSFKNWTLEGQESSMTSLTGPSTFTMGIVNATLTANWDVNQYTLTVKQGCNKGNKEYKISYGGSTTIDTLTCTGYTFSGYEESDSNLSGTTYSMNSEGNKTLTAVWTPNKYKWLVNHNLQNVDGNGYTLDSTTTGSGNYNTEFPGSDIRKTYTGFSKPTENLYKTIGVDVLDGQSGTPTNNVLNYNYTRNQCNLTIDGNGGTYTGTSPLTMYYDSTTTLTLPENTAEWKFTGWQTPTCGSISGTTYTMGDCTSGASITAAREKQKYTVSVTWGYISKVNGVSTTGNPTSGTYDYGTEIETTANSLSSNGYTSWTENGTGKQIRYYRTYSYVDDKSSETFTVSGTKTVTFSQTYTDSSPQYRYYVTMNSCGTSGWTNDNGDQKFTLPSGSSCSNPGYIFNGWSTSSTATSGTAEGTVISISAPTTYYPAYRAATAIEVSYTNNGQTTVQGALDDLFSKFN